MSASNTHRHLLIQSREQDLYSSGVVVYSLLTCVNLSKVHVLAVTNIWTQRHSTQKNVKWNVKEDKSVKASKQHSHKAKNDCVSMKHTDTQSHRQKSYHPNEKGYFFGFMCVSKFRVYVSQHVQSLKVTGLYIQGSLAEETGHLIIKGIYAFLCLQREDHIMQIITNTAINYKYYPITGNVLVDL